ncbi:hypothetical protein [Actinoplanes missouriensis]|nr:hypothetical protein [Actinoplanes missouriensis]
MMMQHLLDTVSAAGDQFGAVLAAPPKPGDVDLPANAQDKLVTVLSWAARLVYVACTFGFLYAAGKMAISHQRGDDVQWGRLGAVAAACIIGGGVSGIVDALF